MSRKSLSLLSLALMVAALGAASPVLAIRVDPDLAAALAAKIQSDKTPDAMVPVLLIYEGGNRPDDDLLEGLAGSPAGKRRDQVIAALKKKMKTLQAEAMSVLANPGLAGQVANVRPLYLAGAISFEGTQGAVMALSHVPGEATLFHDSVRATTDAVHPAAPAADKLMPAATDTAWSVKYINAPKVWSQFGLDGTGVVVGHIDSGVWMFHPDLAGGIWRNTDEIIGNGIDDDANGFIDDWRGWDFGDNDNNPDDDSAVPGHGTHTAGTVIGDGTVSVLTGVAPGAKLMPVKVFNAAGYGGSLGTVWAAEQYCVENGARIITMSLGFIGNISAAFMHAERDNCANLRDAGVFVCNAAGNNHDDFDPPLELNLTARVPAPWNPLPTPWSSLGGIVTVGATGYHDHTVYSGSSQGPAKWDNIDPFNDWPYLPGPGLTKPDVSAPGVNVNSTTIGGGYSGDTWTGTSMACPHVAGVAALMLQRNPSLSPAGIDSLLEQTALDLGATGKDNTFGSGLIDAFAAVQSVPVSMRPDLVWMGTLPDPTGDRVLEPGQTNPIAFSLYNASPSVAATGITASLAVVANPYVTVVDPTGSFPTLAPSGIVGNNILDPFSLHVAADAPQGYRFTMLLTVQATGGFQRTFDVDWFVGLPDWRTHDLGGVSLTVTDRGIIGFLSDDATVGDGLRYHHGGGLLYVGSFWAGTDAGYVCNRDYSGNGSEIYEWRATTTPNGRVRDLGAAGSDQTFAAVFSDAGHASPKPLQVEQQSLAFALPDNDRFVILEYRLTNQGPTSLPDLYTGVYCDFDIVNSGTNYGGTDPARKLTYMYSNGGPYCGVALLGGASATNLTLVSNTTYVYPTLAVTDANKIALLRGQLTTPAATTAGDWSALTSARVSLAAGGGQATVAYAVVYGATLADLQAAADAANALYTPVAPVTAELPYRLLRLAPNHPNPFNPATTISYEVAREGQVQLEVFDLSGSRVRTLVDGVVAAGAHTALWDGRDDAGSPVASGTYFCRLTAAGEVAARKMTLIK